MSDIAILLTMLAVAIPFVAFIGWLIGHGNLDRGTVRSRTPEPEPTADKAYEDNRRRGLIEVRPHPHHTTE